MSSGTHEAFARGYLSNKRGRLITNNCARRYAGSADRRRYFGQFQQGSARIVAKKFVGSGNQAGVSGKRLERLQRDTLATTA